MRYSGHMSHGGDPQIGETGPERILSREEVLSQLQSRCESFTIEQELGNDDGVYFLEVLSSDNTRRYTYQRKGSFSKDSLVVESAGTIIYSEDLDDGRSRVIADYDLITESWID